MGWLGTAGLPSGSQFLLTNARALPSDCELMDPKATIEAVLAGDDARFTDIVLHFDAPVRRIVGQRMRDSHALEEVVQETWLRAYRRLSKLGDTRRLEAWLGTIARNCVCDHFRRRERMVHFEPLVECAEDSDPVTWVWDLVAQLDPLLRDVLIWRYREQLSYADIAELISVPVSTVRGRLFQARNSLRDLLERKEC